MRKVKIEDKNLLKLLKEKKKVVEKGRKLSGQFEQLSNQLKQSELKVNQFNEKIKPMVDKHKIKTEKYEILNRIEVDKGKIVITVLDQIEEYQKMLDDKIKKEKEVKEHSNKKELKK
jgi:hypothetical protein